MTSFVEEQGEWLNRKISIVGALQSFITQLSIGDDLTKISLPSALLFPYSGLELSAVRGISSIHYLLRANRETDPIARMLGVVRWWLTYTQQEKPGKKPYNPILAETHISWVDLSGDDYATEGGPFKGITKYVSEQVSHHPPITGFLAENVEEGLRLEANIKFTTQFHGNSATALPTGATYIDFSKHEERYIISKSLPDMGIKNVILGTRRHAWEGQLEIVCEKSGLKANFNYYEEGWYCINTVNGSISRVDDSNKKLYTFYGPLAQTVNVTNCQTNKIEPLINLASYKKNKLQYIPFDKLDDRSSVKIWRELSKAIVADDMYTADIAKRAVEDAQRQRRRDETSYHPHYFAENSDKTFWAFKTELSKEVDERIMDAMNPVPAVQNTTNSETVSEEKQ